MTHAERTQARDYIISGEPMMRGIRNARRPKNERRDAWPVSLKRIAMSMLSPLHACEDEMRRALQGPAVDDGYRHDIALSCGNIASTPRYIIGYQLAEAALKHQGRHLSSHQYRANKQDSTTPAVPCRASVSPRRQLAARHGWRHRMSLAAMKHAACRSIDAAGDFAQSSMRRRIMRKYQEGDINAGMCRMALSKIRSGDGICAHTEMPTLKRWKLS